MVKALFSVRIRLIAIAILTVLRFLFSAISSMGSPEPLPATAYFGMFLFALGNTALAWEVNRWLVVWFTQRYGSKQIGTRRFVTEIGLVLVANTLVYAVHLSVVFALNPGQGLPLYVMLFDLLDRWVFGLLFAGFYELMVFVHALQTARQEAEELKKLNVTIQLESLKNQVKPHFLFNSLNTLTGLVENHSDDAVRFIAELSSVYRYLLQSSEKELIALREELRFSRAYFFLLQMRFGNAVQLVEEVRQGVEDFLIPPLTLQMLLENCIKHNQVSARKPLTISLSAQDDGWLVVTNNLQPKRSPQSTGVGLSNIAAKLRLLNQPPIEIQKTENHFIIRIPLIKPATA